MCVLPDGSVAFAGSTGWISSARMTKLHMVFTTKRTIPRAVHMDLIWDSGFPFISAMTMLCGWMDGSS